MRTLPYDYARCAGTTAPMCQGCRRREPGRPEWQSYVMPAWTLQGCVNYIEPAIQVRAQSASQPVDPSAP